MFTADVVNAARGTLGCSADSIACTLRHLQRNNRIEVGGYEDFETSGRLHRPLSTTIVDAAGVQGCAAGEYAVLDAIHLVLNLRN